MNLQRINKFYAPIKMLKLRDLETYLKVKYCMEENDISTEELTESMDCKKVTVTVSHDGITKKFYSLAFAARYMRVSLATVYYSYSNKNNTVFRRKGKRKLFYVKWGT